MALKKKGQIFTGIMVLVFIMVVALIPSPKIDQSYKDLHKWENLIMRNAGILYQLENSVLPRATRTISYCAMKEVAELSKTEVNNMNKIENRFKDFFISSSECNPDFTDFVGQLENVLKGMQVELELNSGSIQRIVINESEPFSFNVFFNISYNLSVPGNRELMFFRRNTSVNVTVPIFSITDPLSKHEIGESHKIAYSPGPSRQIFNYFFAFDVPLSADDEELMRCFNKTDTAQDCTERTIDKKWFYYSDYAPSFLQRLRGESESRSECCGIMTILDNTRASQAAIPHPGGTYNQSFVDFCYYQTNPSNCPHSNSTCKNLVNITFGAQRVMIDVFNLYRMVGNATWIASLLSDEKGAVMIGTDTVCGEWN